MNRKPFSGLYKRFFIWSDFTFFIFVFFGVNNLWAVRPIVSNYLDLVAGSGEVGFEDGNFTRARFKAPMGLALSPDSSKLYVADSGNNRIRVIHLDENNRVDTLSGQDTPGKKNGLLSQARFDQPQNVVCLPGDRLAVNDFGNKLIRLIDLKSGMVSTLAGGSPTTLAEGPASLVSMAGIRDMVYLSAADSLFFTNLDAGALWRLDLKSENVTMIPMAKEGPSRPTALCVTGTGAKLYIGELNSTRVFSLDWKADVPATLAAPLTSTGYVLSLAESNGYLYALQNSIEVPFQRLLPANLNQPLTFVTVWGDQVPSPGQTLFPFVNLSENITGGFISDPNNERKFYISNPKFNSIFTYRDIYGWPTAGGDGRNSIGVGEAENPQRKSQHTYRILYVGDSRSCMVVTHPFKGTSTTDGGIGWPPRILSTSKRLELELNTLAAMDDQPVNFEVFNLAHSGGDPLFLWPDYEVPDVCKKDDIDLVVILQPPTDTNCHPFLYYFECPITKEGILNWPWDMEYRLKPPQKRIPEGEAREFYDLSKKEGLVSVVLNNYAFDESLYLKPEFHDVLVRMYGKPLDWLNRQLSQIKTSAGQPVRLVLCTTHTGMLRPNPEDPKIWDDVCKKYDIYHMDTDDEMTAFRTTFYPLSEGGGASHLDPEGNMFLGALLAHDLIRDGHIPWIHWPAPTPTPPTTPLPVNTPATNGGH